MNPREPVIQPVGDERGQFLVKTGIVLAAIAGLSAAGIWVFETPGGEEFFRLIRPVYTLALFSCFAGVAGAIRWLAGRPHGIWGYPTLVGNLLTVSGVVAFAFVYPSNWDSTGGIQTLAVVGLFLGGLAIISVVGVLRLQYRRLNLAPDTAAIAAGIVGIVLGLAAGLVAIVPQTGSSMFGPLIQAGVVLTGIGVLVLVFGCWLSFSGAPTKRSLMTSGVGLLLGLIAIGGFVFAYPDNWYGASDDVTLVVAAGYGIGLILLTHAVGAQAVRLGRAVDLPTEVDPLVTVDGLRKYFWEHDTLIDRLLRHDPTKVRAVDDISLEINAGETLGLVGESGCGKSTAGETLLHLQPPTDGEVRFAGESVFEMSGFREKAFRRRAQILFQDPFSSLDPRLTIGDIVREPLDVHNWPRSDPTVGAALSLDIEGITRDAVQTEVASNIDTVVTPASGVATAEVTIRPIDEDEDHPTGPSRSIADGYEARVRDELAVELTTTGEGEFRLSVSVAQSKRAMRRQQVIEMLERVGLSGDLLNRYPHEFSGGQRQRIAIARALVLEPEFVVLDEPTSALDVSVQAQVLNLLDELQSEFDLTYLLISHDLSVIRHISDRMAVMYLGELVEVGPVEELFTDPAHPYTRALLESVPRASTDERYRERETISGDVPSPRDPPSGCRFRTRCPEVIPPDDLDIEQSVFRSIMDFRQAVHNRAITVEHVGEESADDTEIADVDMIESILERHFEDGLPARHESVITEAIGHIMDDDWADAEALLTERYTSICETDSPSLLGDHHPVACHLRNPPAHREGHETPADD